MSLATICLPVQTELRELEDELSKQTSSDIELVTRAASYVLRNGGKRIRPAILLLTAKMLGYRPARAVPLGVAIEMIHAASLMHDDVIDNATLRRGKQSANIKWGNQISVLVGDFLWSRASRLAIEQGNMKVLSSLTEAAQRTTEGEILEITHINDFGLTAEEYLRIIELKTAVLFSSACQIGAILASGPKKFEEACLRFGRAVGMAFQLADDVLDLTSSEEKFGKKTGTDLCEGRLTLPVILALKRCAPQESDIIKETLLSSSLDRARLNDITRILVRYGAIEESLGMARDFAATAKEELSAFKPSLEKEALIAIADHAVSRSE